VARKPSEGLSFEDLLKELRSYLAEVSGDSEVTRTIRQLQAAQARVQGVTTPESTGTRTGAQAGDPDGVVSGPSDDMKQAKHVVGKLLPSEPPHVPGFDIAHYTRPCLEVGGDYLDYLNLPQDRVAIAIADVAGKGFSAAIMMAMLREVLHIVGAKEPTPARAVATTNRLLKPDMQPGMFVTMLYGVLNPATRELTLVNAGHCPPIIWRPRLTGARVLDLRGPAIGLLNPDQFAKGIQQKTLALEPGDCLCFFTDGISEAKDLLGEEFGGQRLAQVLRDHAGQPAQEIANAIMAAVDEHTKGAAQHDDITLMILRVSPDGAPTAPPADIGST